MKVLTLNTKSFEVNSLRLMSKLDFAPDLVVGILTGGGYVLEAIKTHPSIKDCLLEVVTLQRTSTQFKQHYLKPLFSVLPYFILNWFRILESKKVEHKISNLDVNKLQETKLEFNLKSEESSFIKKILIVDDAIDTGKTMFIVKNNLQKKFPYAKIEIAVMTWTIETSVVKPDYYMYKNTLLRFPWSNDYK